MSSSGKTESVLNVTPILGRESKAKWIPEFFHILREASLAPTVHNVQPARWRLREDVIELYCDRSCAVPAADPESRDLTISLGAAIEGLCLALNKRGFKAEVEILGLESSPVAIIRPVARAIGEPASDVDSLVEVVEKRQTHRGAFTAASETDLQAFVGHFSKEKSTRILSGGTNLQTVSDLYDIANLDFYRDPDFLKELNTWLRFTPLHSRFHKDGLNSKAMSMDPATASMAAIVMKPLVFRWLDKMGLAKALITESPANLSASAVLFFLRDKNQNYFETGRNLYRQWLTATKLGFALCPISSLTDHRDTRAKFSELMAVGPEQEIVLAFRAGPIPKSTYPHARRDLAEILKT